MGFFYKHISKGTICDCKEGLHASLKSKGQNVPILVYKKPTKGLNAQMHNSSILIFLLIYAYTIASEWWLGQF